MKKYLIIGIVLLLVGCGAVDTASRSTTCTLEHENVSEKFQKVTYVRYIESEGDFITDMIIENTIALNDGAESYREQEEIYQKQFDDIEGVHYEYEIKDSIIVERTIVDLEVVTIQNLLDLGLLTQEDENMPAYISYSASIQDLEESHYSCEVMIKE